MGPEEILAAIDEAIVKVQTNVQTFEKSCGEVSDQAMVLNGIYKEKTDDLMDGFNEMANDVESLTNEIISSAIDQTESVGEEITNEIEEKEGQLQLLVGTQLDGLSEAYDGAQEQILGFIDETVGQVEEIAGGYKEISESYNEIQNYALEKLGDIENQVQEQLSSFIESLTDNLQTSHEEVMTEVNDFMDNALNSDLVNFFEENTGDFTDFGENLIDNVENFGEGLSNKFSELSLELLEYTDQKATEEVKDIVNGMIDQIVGELASVISEAIIKASIGVSVTGTTSPMMPFLIAFNKIFDALEGAIDAWKAFKDALGF